ncbi:hypothetical protein [Marinifilum flexuosum]|uniref:hypothetical protein n=1 Tax=Marinifilum flexuosum TaxID=1117708 RepID=UPI002495470E|nr:hypothetical protein [Marinifilum flexuosum]
MINRLPFLLIGSMILVLLATAFISIDTRFPGIDKAETWNNKENTCEFSDTTSLPRYSYIENNQNDAKIDSNNVRIRKANLIDLSNAYEEKILTNEEFLDNMTDGGGELKAYYLKGQIDKISLWLGLSYGISTYDYYFENEKLFYIHETFKQFEYVDSTGSFNYSKTEQTFTGRYYFMRDILYDYETTGHNRFESDEIDPEQVLIEEANIWIEKLKK